MSENTITDQNYGEPKWTYDDTSWINVDVICRSIKITIIQMGAFSY